MRADGLNFRGPWVVKEVVGYASDPGRDALSLITIPGRYPTMPATIRKTAAWCSALLVIAQMVVGPVAHPMSIATETDLCGQVTSADAAHADGDCGDCGAAPDHAPAGSEHEQPAKHFGCKCACPCGHTPALAMPNLVVMRPALPEALAGEPKGPTFTPPLYDFLRPPN